MGLSPSTLILPGSETTVWMDRISIIIAFIFNSILCIHTISNNIKSKELSKDNPLRAKVSAVTVFCTVWNVWFCIVVFFCSIAYPFKCKFMYIIAIGTYIILKTGFWTFNVLRIEVAFGNSAYRYSRKQMISLIMFLVSNAIIMSITCQYVGMYLGLGFSFKLLTVQMGGLCVVHTKLWFAGIVGICESSASITLFWLFYRRIKVLVDTSNRNNQGSSHGRRIHKILFTTKKYSILIGVSLISTWSALSILLFMDLCLTVSAIDSVINIWCLVLYDQRLNHVYLKIFGCLHKRADAKAKTENNLADVIEKKEPETKQIELPKTEMVSTENGKPVLVTSSSANEIKLEDKPSTAPELDNIVTSEDIEIAFRIDPVESTRL